MLETSDKTGRLVTVFGGSGFVGRHVVRALAREGWRIRVACRRPDLAGHLQPAGRVGQIHAVQANLRFPASVAAAVRGADAVVNLVGILTETGRQRFDAVQAFGARVVARAAKEAGVTQFVQMSALGADPQSDSAYARSKADGEAAALEFFPDATIIRPSIIFLQLLLAVAFVAPPHVHAQTPPAAGATEPVPAQIGQLSKDSVWVPTPDRLIQRMLQIADTTKNDIVYDLGSGDGRIPIAAAKLFGARAVGVELEKNLIDYSRRSARQQGVASRAKFIQEDLFKADISKATVFAIYISPSVMEKLRPKFYDLKPGTRVVSHHFTLGDWEPDEMVQVEERRAYLWVVPAKVEGQWALKLGADDYRLKLAQAWQMLTASAEFAGRPTTAFAARLRGTEIRFAMIDGNGDVRNFTGRVVGDRMAGEARSYDKPPIAWTAQRVQ